MIGTVADGGIGPNTLAKLDEYIEEHGLEASIENFQSARQEYYESLSTFETFGRGWTRRVEETTASALDMI
jgi:lysozyme family protein